MIVVDLCLRLGDTVDEAALCRCCKDCEAGMEQLEFQVKGSSRDPYEITFIKDGDSLTAICTCPAGTYGNFCKHRIAILGGDAKGVVSDNADQVATVVEWLDGTDVEAALVELRKAEAAGGPDKKPLNDAKRKLARAMNT